MFGIGLHIMFAVEMQIVSLSYTQFFVCTTVRWPLRFSWWSVTRVCIWIIWPSSQKFHSWRTDICVMQVEHITAQKLGNARYGLDITLYKRYIALNKLRARCCWTAVFPVPRISPIFFLFYKCIFQVFPCTSVSETLQPPKLGGHLYTGISSGCLQPK